MTTSSSIGRVLLDVDRQRIQALSPRMKLYAVAIAIVNLFVCGLAEASLSADRTGYSISLFVFIHASMYMLLALSYFAGNTQDILRKARIFPTDASARFVFAAAGFFRHPFSLAMITSNLLFLAVLYRERIATTASGLLLFTLLMATIALAAAVVFLVLERRNYPASAALVVVAFCALLMLTASMVFHNELFVTRLPLLRWYVDGIRAAEAGQLGNVALYATRFGIVILLAIATGKRFG